MKIKTKEITIEELEKIEARKHKKPIRPNKAIKKLLQVVSKSELKKVGFTYDSEGMEKIAKDEPCLILMNHSSFIDLKIAWWIFRDRDLQIVCTSDGFVGKEKIMRAAGCIPTQKFVTDHSLVKDMKYSVDKLKTSILLFPEASYSFDGTATPLPDSLSKFIKLLNVPVVFVRTYGAFHRDPLYNGLRLRDVKVSAKVSYILSKDDIKEKSPEEINAVLKECFSFDNFRWQKENNIKVNEDFRTLGLERVLYKCPCCKEEGQTEGKGISFICNNCKAEFEMNESGQMKVKSSGKGVSEMKIEDLSDDDGEKVDFSHIPDWYKWQRKQVRKEIEDGSYKLDIPVNIKVLKGFKAIYEVGKGRLIHDLNGFTLTGCDGKLNYKQAIKSSYSLYSDYFWYEIGDMICIGDNKVLYYCFPEDKNVVVAKARLATEEMFKRSK